MTSRTNPKGDWMTARNLSNKELWRKIYDGFNNETCRKCCQQAFSSSRYMSNPQPVPYIGPDFLQSEHRLMFVGIETYSNWPPRKNCKKIGYSKFSTAQVERLFFRKSPKKSGIAYSPFWNWVNLISTEVLSPKKDPQEAFRRIAYSNLHKCQVRDGLTKDDFDESSYQIDEKSFRNCIQGAGWIYQEIEKIGARNIVVFAGHKEENLLAKIFLGDDDARLLKTFDYDNFNVTPEQREKWKHRDLFVHL